MDYAIYSNGEIYDVVTVEMIENHQVEEENITNCWCEECSGQASIVHRKGTIFFRAFHEPDCRIPKDGRKHKTHRIAESTAIDDVYSIISYRDKEPIPPKKTKEPSQDDPEEGETDVLELVDDIDCINKYGVKHIHTVGGIYDYIRNHGIDADLGEGKTGRDYLLDERALHDVRKNGINDPKIAIVKRIQPSKLDHEIKIPEGYTLFVDCFSADIQTSVFFLVKLSNKKMNAQFREKVMGDEKKRNSHKHLLLLGNWKKVPHRDYSVYKAVVNSRCCKFINYHEA
jgi:hypothetical protein